MQLKAPGPAKFYFGVYASTLEGGYVPLESPSSRCAEDPRVDPNQPRSDTTVHTRQAVESFLCGVSSEDESFRPAIVHFWNDWEHGDRSFPAEIIEWIEALGADLEGPAPVPYISLNMRSHPLSYFVDPVFSLDSIIRGEWDQELHDWGKAAAAYGKPLMVTWAPECNGEFKSHNAVHHGGPQTTKSLFASDQQHPHDELYLTGHERFKMAYRKVVEVVRSAGANNIQWVFHVLSGAQPAPWNRFEEYYPGADVVDWFGVSVYGAQDPDPEEEATPFDEMFRDAYWRIQAIDIDRESNQQRNTPVIITKMGCAMALAENENPPDRASTWADHALGEILTRADGDWTNLKGFTWWNESWLNVYWEDPKHEFKRSVLRIQENAALREVFHRRLVQMREYESLIQTPIID